MAALEKITNVPPSVVNDVRRDFISEGARVKTIRQRDGNYTLQAQFTRGHASKRPIRTVATAQMRIVTFLLWAFAFIFVLTQAIFFLQGFRVFGFSLDSSLLHWLAAASVGEIGGLAVIANGILFRDKKELAKRKELGSKRSNSVKSSGPVNQ